MGNQYKRDCNHISLKNDYAIVHTVYKNLPVEILVDLDDVQELKQYTWSLNREGYVRTRINNKYILMHRFVNKCPDNQVVDHINRNKLDNRKSNLRNCSIAENCHNKNTPSNNKSGITGVLFNEQSKKWRAYIMCNGINYHLGFFNKKEEAIQARKNAEQTYNFL